jgi:hypothetical protein
MHYSRSPHTLGILIAAVAQFCSVASAQPFTPVGAATRYDAGERCAVPFWAVADFNGDGIRDFALANTPISAFSALGKPGAVMMWIADADGSYAERATQLFNAAVPAGINMSQLRIADFNGDGIPDFVVPDSGTDTYVNGVPVGPWLGSTPKLALSNGNGQWIDASNRFASLPPTFSHTAAVADINGDGKPDIYIGSISGGSQAKLPYLLVNSGGGNFSYSQSLLPPEIVRDGYAPVTVVDANTKRSSGQQFTGSLFVDVNNDGAPDLVLMPNNSTETGFLLLNNGRGDFSTSTPIKMPPGLWGGGNFVQRTNPDGSISISATRGTVSLDVQAMHINGDGFLDLVVLQTVVDENPADYTQYRGGRIQVLINQGGRGFVDETELRGAPGFASNKNYDSYHGTLSVFDVNGDGFTDLIALRTSDIFESHVFLNDGSGRFTRATAIDGLPLDRILIPVSGVSASTIRMVGIKVDNYTNGPPYGCWLTVQTFEKPAPLALTEYFYAPMSYYFATSRPAEKALLDGFNGWRRTGGSIRVLPAGTLGTAPISRYYFDQVAKQKARGTHFYTLLDSERSVLAALNPGNSSAPGKPFNEGIDSYAYLPQVEGVSGSCAAAQRPVYRVFRGNQRFPDDPNHRLTTDLTLYNQLVAEGWDGEGVRFCVPQ